MIGPPCTLVGPRCRRQRVVGVDLWVHCPAGSGEAMHRARCAAVATHLRLHTAFEEHLAEQDDEQILLRMRFLARCEEVHLTDEAILELLLRLSGQLRWVRLSKLEEFDGVPNFVPLPALPSSERSPRVQPK